MTSGEESYRRYLSGDDSALGDIVGLYNKNLILFIYGFIRNISDAEDIAADTFLDLVMKKPVFRGESSFKTWLFRIARNKATDYLRKYGRLVPETDERLDLSPSGENAEEGLLSDEKSRQLYKAIDRLPEDYRQALRLIYFCDMSYDEAGAVMKKSKKQINNLAYRSRLALKAELAKEGFIYEDN